MCFFCVETQSLHLNESLTVLKVCKSYDLCGSLEILFVTGFLVAIKRNKKYKTVQTQNREAKNKL